MSESGWIPIRESIHKTASSGSSVRDLEVSFAQETARSVRPNFAELIEINGEPCALSAVADITEAKKSEEARQASEGRFSQFFRLCLNTAT